MLPNRQLYRPNNRQPTASEYFTYPVFVLHSQVMEIKTRKKGRKKSLLCLCLSKCLPLDQLGRKNKRDLQSQPITKDGKMCVFLNDRKMYMGTLGNNWGQVGMSLALFILQLGRCSLYIYILGSFIFLYWIT